MTLKIEDNSKNNSPLAHESTSDEMVKLRQQMTDFKPIPIHIAENGLQNRPIRIYLDGVFDLFHYGHGNLFLQAKTYFPGPIWVIAGVSNEQDCIKYKRKPIMRTEERVLSVRHCRHVDEVIQDAPWITTIEFLNEHKIDYVMHDQSPYPCGNVTDVYAELKKENRFIPSRRTENTSTTEIIDAIIRSLIK